TLLDTDFADESLAFEILEVDRASGARLRAQVIGLEPERAIEDCFERGAVDVRGFGVPVGGAFQDPALEHLATLVRSISEGDHGVEHLAAAILAALEHAVLTDTARIDVQDTGRDRALRDKIELGRRRIRVVPWHG